MLQMAEQLRSVSKERSYLAKRCPEVELELEAVKAQKRRKANEVVALEVKLYDQETEFTRKLKSQKEEYEKAIKNQKMKSDDF
jgi:hypothetical protein